MSGGSLMGHYSVVGSVLWALPISRPASIPKSRPRGAKAHGLRYERTLAKALPEAQHGQWYEFRDAAGRHFCQLDLLLRPKYHAPVVLEVKYTWVLEAHTQLARLYMPVVERALGVRPLGIVLCKNLTPETPRKFLARDWSEALALANAGLTPILQHIGGPLRTHFPDLLSAPLAPGRIAA